MKPLPKLLSCLIILFSSLTITIYASYACSVAVNSNPPYIPTGGTSTITARVVDSQGRALVNHSVFFFSGGKGSFSPNPATTDTSGIATTYYTNTSPGHITIGATDTTLDPDVTGYGAVDVVRAEIRNIKFTSDYSDFRKTPEGQGNEWNDSSIVFEEPEWAVAEPMRNNPITQTKNTTLTIDVTVKVEPSGIAYNLIGDGPDNYVDFIKTGNTSTGSDQTLTAISASATLPNNVANLSKSIAWKIVCTAPTPDVDVPSTTTYSHKIYVTYGTPTTGSVVTEQRMGWACSTANGQSTLQGIADAIYNDFYTPPPYFDLQASAPSPLWLLMAGSQYKGQCIDQANLMKLALEILGGTASIGYIYGSTDADCYSTSSNAFETRICPGGLHGDEVIRVYAGGGWNNWEAVCVVNGKYYAIQIDSGTVAVDILRTWLGSNQTSSKHQGWRYYDSEWQSCTNPGPYPVPKP